MGSVGPPAAGILRKQNVMHVTGEQVMQLSLDDRLFGPAESTLVTRNQLTELASEIYTTLVWDRCYKNNM